ncbi:hypothetical protein [Spirillospora sp. CA-294931]
MDDAWTRETPSPVVILPGEGLTKSVGGGNVDSNVESLRDATELSRIL